MDGLPNVRGVLRRTTVLLLVAVGLVALPACSGDDDRLVVYSGRTRNLISPLLERFSEETGIDITVRYDDSANLALLVDSEGDRTPADVFISQSPGAVGFLDQKGRLAPLGDDVTTLVPDGFRAPDATWVGLSGRVRVLVYNTELVTPADLPRSVLDLVQPAYKGRVAVAPSNGSFQDFVTAMRANLGEDATAAWLSGMAANDAAVYANNTAIVQAVGRGEVPMGLVNHYYHYRAQAEDPDLPTANHLFPGGDIGALLIATAASVVKGSDRMDDAQRLVRFMLSEEAQEFFAEETFEYPLIAGVSPMEAVPPLDSTAVATVDLSDLGGGLERTKELIDRSGIAD